MNTRRNRFSAVAMAVIALLCLTASSRAFITKPDGCLSDGVVFHFYESADAKQASKLNIIEFVVQEQKSEKEWTTMWELKGKYSLDALRYGEKYGGLTESASARPLSRTAKYRALVSEQAWLNPIGYSAVYFVFDENGSVVVSGPK